MNFLSVVRKRAILILIFIIIFYVAFAIFYDASQFFANVEKINYFFIPLILLAFTASIMIKSLRQFLFLRHIGINIPLKQNITLFFSGLSMLFTPAGMGEMIKSHFLAKRYDYPVPKTIPIVLVERYHDALALFSLIAIFAIIISADFLFFPLLVIGILLLVSLIIVRRKRTLEIILNQISRISFLKKIGDKSSEFNESLVSFSSKKILISGWVFSLAAWSLDAFGIYLCFQAFELDFNFLLTTVIGFSSILFGAISLIPGGIGITEVSFVALLSLYDVDSSLSSSLALFFRLLSIWYATCLGIIAMRFILKWNPIKQ